MWNDPRTEHAWIVERVDDNGEWLVVATCSSEEDARRESAELSAIFFDDVFRVRYR